MRFDLPGPAAPSRCDIVNRGAPTRGSDGPSPWPGPQARHGRRLAALVAVAATTLLGLAVADPATASAPRPAPHASTSPAAAKAAAAKAAAEARAVAARVAPSLVHRAATQVYIVPHADDETLTMGAAIAADVRAGRRVVVALVTTGTSSRTLNIVDAHLTAQHRSPLTMGEFVAAREREFDTATARLGVPRRGLVHLRMADPGRDSAALAAVVARLVARYGPAVGYNTMSFMDRHPTHYGLGYGLDRLCLAGRVRECHFYQYLAYQVGTRAPALVSAAQTPAGAWIDERTGRLRSAAAAYALWDPARGFYGIGGLWSVPTEFADLLRRPRSWTHGTSAATNWLSDAHRLGAARWAYVNQNPLLVATIPGLALPTPPPTAPPTTPIDPAGHPNPTAPPAAG